MVGNAWFAGGAMAHFLRLIFALILTLGLISIAQADQIPAPYKFKYGTQEGFDTPEAACTYAATTYGAGVSYTGTEQATALQWKCYLNIGLASLFATKYYYCITGVLDSTNTPPVCNVPACPEGQTRNANGTCSVPCINGDTSLVGAQGYSSGLSGGKVCNGSCEFNVTNSACITLTNGTSGCGYTYGRGNGNTCSPSTATGSPTPDQQCAAQGKSSITVGGVTSCVAAGTPGSNPVSTSTSSSSSSSSTNSDGSPGTSGSSSTGSSTTANGDGTATTTTTVVNGDGSTSTTTTTESMDDFCAKNPTVNLCKAATESDISGACDAVACKGDAIQCAMAKEQARRNCEWFKENATAKALGEAMADGTDTTPNPADSSNRETVNVQSSLDSSSPISASCFTDLTVTLLGQSATLPLSDWCPFFEALGYIFLALSYMAALRIVAGVIV